MAKKEITKEEILKRGEEGLKRLGEEPTPKKIPPTPPQGGESCLILLIIFSLLAIGLMI